MGVAVSGRVNFLGLLAPHIARRLVGNLDKHMLIFLGIIGIPLVLIADFIARIAFLPVELPDGVVIANIGLPYFVYLLSKRSI